MQSKSVRLCNNYLIIGTNEHILRYNQMYSSYNISENISADPNMTENYEPIPKNDVRKKEVNNQVRFA